MLHKKIVTNIFKINQEYSSTQDCNLVKQEINSLQYNTKKGN